MPVMMETPRSGAGKLGCPAETLLPAPPSAASPLFHETLRRTSSVEPNLYLQENIHLEPVPESYVSRLHGCDCVQSSGAPTSITGIAGASLQANLLPMRTIFGATSQVLFRGSGAFCGDAQAQAQAHAQAQAQGQAQPSAAQKRAGSSSADPMLLPSTVQGGSHPSGKFGLQLSTRMCVSLPHLPFSSPELSSPRGDSDGLSVDSAAAAARARRGKLPGAFSTSRLLSQMKSKKMASFSMSFARAGRGLKAPSPAYKGEGCRDAAVLGSATDNESLGGATEGSAPETDAGAGHPCSSFDRKRSFDLPRAAACIPAQGSSCQVLWSLKGGKDPPQGAHQKSPRSALGGQLGVLGALRTTSSASATSAGSEDGRSTASNHARHKKFALLVGGRSQAHGGEASAAESTSDNASPEWVEVFSGEDRAQVVVSLLGHTFVAVYDGFMDCAAVDFLMSHFYPCLEEELLSLSLPAGMPCQHADTSGQVHVEVMSALERAYSRTHELYEKFAHVLFEDNPELAVAGACIAAALIIGQHLYILNIGDCSVLLVEEPSGQPPAAVPSTAQQRGQGHAQEEMPLQGFKDPGHASGNGRVTSEGQSSGARMPKGPWGAFVNGTSVSNGAGEAEDAKAVAGVASKGGMPEHRSTSSLGECLLVLEGALADGSIGEWRGQQLTVEHNTNNEEEVERIRREHEDDPDAIDKDRVKGKLKVTRAFGGIFMKEAEMNCHLFSCFRIKYVGTRPYVGSTPFVQHRALHGLKGYLVVSSDGLYQSMNPGEVPGILRAVSGCTSGRDPNAECREMAHRLLTEAVDRAVAKSNVSLEELDEVTPGDSRRKIHDDITIAVLRISGSAPNSLVSPPHRRVASTNHL